jgi:hypothetical protein
MSTGAFISGYTFSRSNGDSPDTFADFPEVIEISGFGQSNNLVRATHFASGGVEEYINGLSDGEEFTITCNRLPDNTVQSNAIADVGNKTGRTYRISEADGRGNAETFTFHGVPMSWGIGPQVDDRATLTFGFKISGPITKG